MLKRVLSIFLAACMALSSYPVAFAAKSEKTGDYVPEAVSNAEFVNVTIIYKDENGNELSVKPRTIVEEGKQIPATSLKAPKGYEIDYNKVGKIDWETNGELTCVVGVKSLKPATKFITVKYETSTGIEKGRENIIVAKEATEISVDSLKKIPEGYNVVGKVEIDGRFATAIVEPIVVTKMIKVTYKTSTGMYKGEENVKVIKGTTEISVDSLKKIPEGYNVVGKVEIDGRFATAIVEPAAPKSRLIRVEYINPAGAVVASKRVDVKYGRLTITVTAPEHYVLADTNNVISIDDSTELVKVQVMKEVKPLTKLIKVTYKTSTGVYKGEESVKVSKEASVIPVTDLMKVPEGYEVVGEVKIDGRFATAIVEPITLTKLIKVTYKTSTGVYKGEENVKVSKEASVIPVTDLMKVPEGYKVVGEVKIDRRFATAIVEPIADNEPDVDNNEKPRPRPNHKHDDDDKPSVKPYPVIKPVQNPSTGANI